jgi:hypothetical protein
MAATPHVKGAQLEELQQFDVMLQTLAAPAEFMHRLALEAHDIPPLPLARLTAAVRLSDLRLRLSGTGLDQREHVL